MLRLNIPQKLSACCDHRIYSSPMFIFLLLERFLFTFFVHVFCSNRLWTLQPVLSKTVETAIVLLQNEFAFTCATLLMNFILSYTMMIVLGLLQWW